MISYTNILLSNLIIVSAFKILVDITLYHLHPFLKIGIRNKFLNLLKQSDLSKQLLPSVASLLRLAQSTTVDNVGVC
jgi:hypothetical protein